MDCDRLTLPEIPVPKERPPWFIHPALPGTGSDELTLKVGALTSEWQAGVATMSCCHGIQVFYLRNSLNFHKNGIQVRIKA